MRFIGLVLLGWFSFFNHVFADLQCCIQMNDNSCSIISYHFPEGEKGECPAGTFSEHACCDDGKCRKTCNNDGDFISLISFHVVLVENTTQVNWVTGYEENNDGMNLWCAQMQDDQFREITQLNSQLIPSKAILPNYGASYSSTDYPYINTNLKSGVQHCTLEDIDASGQCTLHCDQIDTVIIGESNNLSDTELNQLQAKAIALCHEHKQDGVCLDQLLAPNQ